MSSLICEGCIEGQQLRVAFPSNKRRRATKPLESAPSDVFCRMRDVELVNECTSSENDLEMHLSGRNKTLMVVGLVEFSKSPLFDVDEDIAECKEQVRDKLVAIQEPKRGPTNKGCLSTPPPRNNSNKEMQPILLVDIEGQPIEEQKYLKVATVVW